MNLTSMVRALFAFLAVSAPAFAGQTTFRIVAYLQDYNQPIGLIEGSPGTFYSNAGGGRQTIFSVTAQGSITSLAYLPPPDITGSPVVSGPDGRYYSTIGYGGTPSSNVVSVSKPAGSLKTYPTNPYVPFFAQNLPDGTLLACDGTQLLKSDPSGNVTSIFQVPTVRIGVPLYGTDGNYYGVAEDQTAAGYVYKLTPSGVLTQLAAIPGNPFDFWTAPLIEGSDGNFYGTTNRGGANGNGFIYKVTRNGQYATLFNFPKGSQGGASMIADSIIAASDGKIYGTTAGNGISDIYSITTSGQYQVVYRMSNPGVDGQCDCSLVQGSDGQIYGTAQYGGPIDAGAVFALDAGLPKPAPRAQHFQPKSGAAGTPVRIWGYNLLSAGVQFNGMAATEVHSSGSNYVWATVPAGATTGPITVSTPGGTVTTKASFTVE